MERIIINFDVYYIFIYPGLAAHIGFDCNHTVLVKIQSQYNSLDLLPKTVHGIKIKLLQENILIQNICIIIITRLKKPI